MAGDDLTWVPQLQNLHILLPLESEPRTLNQETKLQSFPKWVKSDHHNRQGHQPCFTQRCLKSKLSQLRKVLRYAFSISALPSLDKELWAEITKISNCPARSLPLFLIAVFFERPHPTNSFYSQVYTLFSNMFLCSKAFLYSFSISTGLNMSSDS